MAKNETSASPADGETTETKNYGHIGAEWGIFGAATSTQPTAVVDPSGGATVDAQARLQLSLLLARLRTLGIIAT